MDLRGGGGGGGGVVLLVVLVVVVVVVAAAATAAAAVVVGGRIYTHGGAELAAKIMVRARVPTGGIGGVGEAAGGRVRGAVVVKRVVGIEGVGAIAS